MPTAIGPAVAGSCRYDLPFPALPDWVKVGRVQVNAGQVMGRQSALGLYQTAEWSGTVAAFRA